MTRATTQKITSNLAKTYFHSQAIFYSSNVHLILHRATTRLLLLVRE